MVDELYRQGVALIWPHIRLVDRARTDSEDDEVAGQIREGMAKLEAVLAEAPGHWPSYWLLGKAHEALGAVRGRTPLLPTRLRTPAGASRYLPRTHAILPRPGEGA